MLWVWTNAVTCSLHYHIIHSSFYALKILLGLIPSYNDQSFHNESYKDVHTYLDILQRRGWGSDSKGEIDNSPLRNDFPDFSMLRCCPLRKGVSARETCQGRGTRVRNSFSMDNSREFPDLKAVFAHKPKRKKPREDSHYIWACQSLQEIVKKTI